MYEDLPSKLLTDSAQCNINFHKNNAHKQVHDSWRTPAELYKRGRDILNNIKGEWWNTSAMRKMGEHRLEDKQDDREEQDEMQKSDGEKKMKGGMEWWMLTEIYHCKKVQDRKKERMRDERILSLCNLLHYDGARFLRPRQLCLPRVRAGDSAGCGTWWSELPNLCICLILYLDYLECDTLFLWNKFSILFNRGLKSDFSCTVITYQTRLGDFPWLSWTSVIQAAKCHKPPGSQSCNLDFADLLSYLILTVFGCQDLRLNISEPPPALAVTAIMCMFSNVWKSVFACVWEGWGLLEKQLDPADSNCSRNSRADKDNQLVLICTHTHSQIFVQTWAQNKALIPLQNQ